MTTDEIFTKWDIEHGLMPYKTITLHAIFLDLKQVCEENAELRKALKAADSADSRVEKLGKAVGKILSTNSWKSYPTRKGWEEIVKFCKDAVK